MQRYNGRAKNTGHKSLIYGERIFKNMVLRESGEVKVDFNGAAAFTATDKRANERKRTINDVTVTIPWHLSHTPRTATF